MRLLIINHIAGALESLRGNRLRTSLTILGVTIGVASIMVILSLSAGATKIITDQVDQLGGTIAVIRPGAPNRESQINNLTSAISGTQITSSLTEQDVNDISNIESIEAVAPLMLLGGSISAGDTTPSNSSLLATTPDFAKITPLPLSDGQFIDSVTTQETAVIGNQLAVDLYGTNQAAGRTFRTHGQDFTVIGVLKRTGNPVNYNNVDFDHAAIINLDSGKAFNQGIASIQQVNIKSKNQDQLSASITAAGDRLAENHGERDFTILSGDSLSRPANELFYTIAATLTVVAAISLIVGGIGIMNIMLVGVTERTREIGIRKAIGASNAHITWQFLIESLALSLAGGFFGYVLGYLVAFGIARSFLTFDPVFSWPIVAAAFGVSLFVGVVFGLYPAIRAARKDPIEALRQYH